MNIEYSDDVIRHLLFHKSLIDEEDANHRINKYIEIVNNLKDGIHLVIKNPFEKSIAIVFELVMEHQIDPWNINLMNFSKMYLDRVKKEKDIDFVTAGRLIFMAWSILKLQSEKLLVMAEPTQQQQDTNEHIDLGIDFYQNPEDLDYTSLVLNSPEVPFKKTIFHNEKKPVSLMDLVNAFDKARREAYLREKILAQRRAKYAIDTDFGSKIHKEDFGQEIWMTWKRILVHNGRKIPLSDITEYKNCGVSNHVDDLVTVLISILFLAQLQWIKITQDEFPNGEIYIENVKPPSNEDINNILKISVDIPGED